MGLGLRALRPARSRLPAAGSEILVEGWVRTCEGADNSGQPATRIEVIAEEITFLRHIEWA